MADEQKSEEKKEEKKEEHKAEGKKYFDNELKVTLIFAVLGFILGYISFALNNPPISFFVMVVAGAAVRLVLKKVMKIKEDIKWWLSTGFVVYIILWLVIWTIFYNVGLR